MRIREHKDVGEFLTLETKHGDFLIAEVVTGLEIMPMDDDEKENMVVKCDSKEYQKTYVASIKFRHG